MITDRYMNRFATGALILLDRILRKTLIHVAIDHRDNPPRTLASKGLQQNCHSRFRKPDVILSFNHVPFIIDVVNDPISLDAFTICRPGTTYDPEEPLHSYACPQEPLVYGHLLQNMD